MSMAIFSQILNTENTILVKRMSRKIFGQGQKNIRDSELESDKIIFFIKSII